MCVCAVYTFSFIRRLYVPSMENIQRRRVKMQERFNEYIDVIKSDEQNKDQEKRTQIKLE